MGITDELRDWAEGDTLRAGMSLRTARDQVLAIADRIDAANESLCLHSRTNGYGDGFIDGFNDIESWVVDHEDAMAEYGFVRLPKDGDGEPINVGDWVVPNGMGTSFRVRRIYFDGEWSLDLEGFGISYTCPGKCRHYHKPTVEDVLRELTTKAWNRGRLGMPVAESNVRKLVSEYAAKLQLAGDDDEQRED